MSYNSLEESDEKYLLENYNDISSEDATDSESITHQSENSTEISSEDTTESESIIHESENSTETSEEYVEKFNKINVTEYTVDELHSCIHSTVRLNFPDDIKVKGEISTAKLSKGNLYITLKEGYASLNVVSWSHSTKVPGPIPNTGDKVTILGSITTYKGGSCYQLLLKNIISDGIGDIHKKYLKTKNTYQQKGFFDDINKKKLPKQIKNIGIISALTGAAITDVLHVLSQNNFSGNVFIKGCNVQGAMCPSSVKKAIQELDKFKYKDNNLDVIIITRGGGAIEDLMGYSDPKILEAVYNASRCIISAVGHEVDTMLSDLVADIRAATPSMAGEIVAKQKMEETNAISNAKLYLLNTLKYKIMDKLNIKQTLLSELNHRLGIMEKSDENLKLEISLQKEKQKSMIMEMLNYYQYKFQQLSKRIDISNPDKILKLGYIIVYDSEGNVIKSIKDLPEKTLKLQFIDGIQTIDIVKIS